MGTRFRIFLFSTDSARRHPSGRTLADGQVESAASADAAAVPEPPDQVAHAIHLDVAQCGRQKRRVMFADSDLPIFYPCLRFHPFSCTCTIQLLLRAILLRLVNTGL